MKDDNVTEAIHEVLDPENQTKTRKVKRWIIGTGIAVGATLVAAVALASRNNNESE